MEPQARQDASYKMKHLAGVLHDKTKIAVKKVKGEDTLVLDIAVVKATIQEEVVPKEKHVRTLKIACSASAPRQQVDYCIHKLAKRLRDQNWLVTLKALVVFHRLMREIDKSFQEAMLKFGERTGAHHLLALDRYADHTTKETWDYSAWIRCYSMYLDERLDVFRALHFDPEQEVAGEGHDSQLKTCGAEELLEKLPRIQKLLARMVACLPEGAASVHPIVTQSCIWVLKESRAIYKVASEGIINLADKFFEMERASAQVGLDLYKENMNLNERLNNYYSAIQQNPYLKGTVQLPTLSSLPPDFLNTMEEYLRDAPKMIDPNAAASRRAGSGTPLLSNRVSSMAARGGTTSAAFAGGSVKAPSPLPALKTPESPAAKTPVQVPAVPAPAPPVDLLSLDDPEPVAAPPPAANGKHVDELDALASGMVANTGTTGFEESAFGAPQHPPVEDYNTPYANGPMSNGYEHPGAMGAQPYGMNAYGANPFGAPMMMGPYAGPTGGGPYAGPTGGGSMALVPYGLSPMMPMMPLGGPYAGPTGGPFAGATGAFVAPTGTLNPFGSPPPPAAPQASSGNPFTSGAPMVLKNDPLSQLTEDLLYNKPKETAPSIPLNQLKGKSFNVGAPQVM